MGDNTDENELSDKILIMLVNNNSIAFKCKINDIYKLSKLREGDEITLEYLKKWLSDRNIPKKDYYSDNDETTRIQLIYSLEEKDLFGAYHSFLKNYSLKEYYMIIFVFNKDIVEELPDCEDEESDYWAENRVKKFT